MSKAYLLGMTHRKIGRPVFCNPFAYFGSYQDRCDWERGWEDADK